VLADFEIVAVLVGQLVALFVTVANKNTGEIRLLSS